ncbi:MAG TPA: tyrosine-protein phosphatase [Stellaceae bacterium]|nr:tyrosine-protein phosphatase [Stellaceae bacterium]
MPDNPDRLIVLEGATNFRDLGGYATDEGRTLRWGMVYRADGLGRLTDRDHDRLAGLGIRSVVDFRCDAERARLPNRLPTDLAGRTHHLSIEPGRRDVLLAHLDAKTAKPEHGRDHMIDVYRSFPIEHAAQFRRFFELLLDDEAVPLVFHCAAGKDRTGFAAALFLMALGVHAETVRADYLLTNRHWRNVSPGLLPPDVLAPIIAADLDYLDAGLAAIDHAHGSIDAFFEQCLGLDAGNRARLRDKFMA